ncbi:endonuclease domain of the non-LTR retrotransposon LINE-1 [Elysia marginata]|uniref:Endonuclease domain of the non-LTR retrotransposon LINE-1 n=1 Tax=Elysia marginata TaxID=1093978 RepID=A0AAV4H4E0_9GAST|nr:endonuclease domain of the non-LTR retrotransposon LINE-1 [Elysia marginata]
MESQHRSALKISLSALPLQQDFNHCDAITALSELPFQQEVNHCDAITALSAFPLQQEVNHCDAASSKRSTALREATKKLALFLLNVKDAYSRHSLPPLGRSNHNLVLPQPIYRPMTLRVSPMKREVMSWTNEAADKLRACLE